MDTISRDELLAMLDRPDLVLVEALPADQYDAELIVLGARGLSAFKSMILGSVSHSVAQHARRPVLIVPPAVREDKAVEPAEHAVATA